MITGADILRFLRPDGGWTIYGDDFDSIIYDAGVTPVSQKEFEDAKNKVEQWKIEQVATLKAKREALLEKLGITEDEAQLLAKAIDG